MRRWIRTLVRGVRHPLGGAVVVVSGSWALIVYGIPYLPPLFGVESAPVPDSVVWQYMLSILLAVGLYVSADEERWRRFRAPIRALLADPGKRGWRFTALGAAMLLTGWSTYRAVEPSYGAPPSLRSVHPAPPDRIDFRGRTIRLSGLQNPLREEGSREEHVARGARIYAKNCVPCHGDRLDGDGHFADAFTPAPIDLTSGGNLPQLSESFVFWRIAKGGPGLPSEGTPWNSAMPVWEDVLTEREIWSVILFLYERTGFTPRAEGGHGEGGDAEATAGRRGDGSPLPLVASVAAQGPDRGERLYRRRCQECHGAEGEGDGPAADRMLPLPRDLSEARYQIRRTASGQLPTDADLHRVIRDGIPGTTMPGWPGLDRSQREDLIAYLKGLSRFFGRGEPPEPMELGEDPGGGSESVEAGREVFGELECYRCHGQAGRGDGESAPTLEDWRENPIAATDLTEPWTFNGGSSVEEIHTRFLTGLDGTPMPSQADALEAGVVDEEDLWNLAHYVRSLGPENAPPRVRDAALVQRAEDGLPAGPTADAWEDVPRFYFPLAGQVIERPRQFAPRVDGLWVQGVHDGEEMVLRVSWSDPSESPDSAWVEWQREIAATLADDGTAIPTDPLADRLALQFPTSVPEGRERPYFLMGGADEPVYLWRWDSERGHREATAVGLGQTTPLAEAQIDGSAEWEAGQWRVTFRRSLPGQGENRISFPAGVPVPVAFFAWDGNNGEDETRGAVSGWYFLILQEATGPLVYATPALAVLLTAAVGLFAARRARRRREGAAE